MPFLVLGVLTLLVVAAAILGVVQAPTGTDLSVHNAVNQTLTAERVTGNFTQSGTPGTVHFTFVAPDHVTAYLAEPNKGASQAPRSSTGPSAKNVLEPVMTLGTLSGFRGNGAKFVISKPIAALETGKPDPSLTGSFRAIATVATGYVVRVREDIAVAKGGRQFSEQIDYKIQRVDGWTRT